MGLRWDYGQQWLRLMCNFRNNFPKNYDTFARRLSIFVIYKDSKISLVATKKVTYVDGFAHVVNPDERIPANLLGETRCQKSSDPDPALDPNGS